MPSHTSQALSPCSAFFMVQHSRRPSADAVLAFLCFRQTVHQINLHWCPAGHSAVATEKRYLQNVGNSQLVRFQVEQTYSTKDGRPLFEPHSLLCVSYTTSAFRLRFTPQHLGPVPSNWNLQQPLDRWRDFLTSDHVSQSLPWLS